MSVQALFWLIAVILFVVSSFWNPPRVSLLSLGLAFFAGGFLIEGIDIHE